MVGSQKNTVGCQKNKGPHNNTSRNRTSRNNTSHNHEHNITIHHTTQYIHTPMHPITIHHTTKQHSPSVAAQQQVPGFQGCNVSGKVPRFCRSQDSTVAGFQDCKLADFESPKVPEF